VSEGPSAPRRLTVTLPRPAGSAKIITIKYSTIWVVAGALAGVLALTFLGTVAYLRSAERVRQAAALTVEVSYLRDQNDKLLELDGELRELIRFQERMLQLAGIDPALRRDASGGDNSYELGALDSTGMGNGRALVYWPVVGETIRGFTADHPGIDIAAPRRRTIAAAAAGTVIDVGHDPTLGDRIVIEHSDSLRTVYANNELNLVAINDAVEPGQIIALVGRGPEGAEPHLHFEVWLHGNPVPPARYLPDLIGN